MVQIGASLFGASSSGSKATVSVTSRSLTV